MNSPKTEDVRTNSVTVKSYAKINLSLDVRGRRADGYHEVSMILQAIELHDDVECEWTGGESCMESGESSVESSESCERRIEIKVIQSEADRLREPVPEDERNIAYKAAAMMLDRSPGAKGEVKITITKRIPAAAGLAGGSGNGAAVLLAMRHLMRQDLEIDELFAMAAELGADVPFQMMVQMKTNPELGLAEDPRACVCALAEGTGTELTPVSPLDCRLVLVTPEIGVSTKEVYEGIDRAVIGERPDNRELALALERKDDTIVQKNMINVLENYTLSVYDVVYEKKNKMRELCRGRGVALMSGSGPTVFAATRSERLAEEIYEEMERGSGVCYLTGTMTD